MLDSIEGVRVGHAHDAGACTGCTVVLFEKRTMASFVSLGGVTASHFTDGLGSTKSYPQLDALFVVGGSVAGLGVAQPISSFLAEKGVGIPWGNSLEEPATRVPIIAGGVIADRGLFHGPFPYELGREACEKAWAGHPAESRGNTGAGYGATVGKILFSSEGSPLFCKGGLGYASRGLPGGIKVVAMAVVNAIGSIYDRQGKVVAGQLSHDQSRFLELEEVMRILIEAGESDAPATHTRPSSTTVVILGTNAKLNHEDLSRVTNMAQAGIARSIRPCFTSLDGDSVFSFTTCTHALPQRPHMTSGYTLIPGWSDYYGTDLLGIMAAEAVQDAIVDAVERADDLVETLAGRSPKQLDIPCAKTLGRATGQS
jgi:L-aminopeptidase/D-esterase-like protein